MSWAVISVSSSANIFHFYLFIIRRSKFFNFKAFSWLQCYDREVADFSLCCNILVARLQYYEGCCNVIRPAITFFQQLTRSPPSWDISPAGEKLNLCVEKMVEEEEARGNSWRGVCMRIAIGRHSHGATFITPIILITITKGPPSSSSSSSLWTKYRECKQLISVKPCLQNKTRIIVRMWSCEGWLVRAVLTHRPYATRSGIFSLCHQKWDILPMPPEVGYSLYATRSGISSQA